MYNNKKCGIYNNKNARETAKKICSVYGQFIINDSPTRNWILKFHLCNTSLRNEPRPGRSSNSD